MSYSKDNVPKVGETVTSVEVNKDIYKIDISFSGGTNIIVNLLKEQEVKDEDKDEE